MSIYVDHFKFNVALERSRMMFRPQNDVRLCNNTCKHGGTCEYNIATNSTKCRCIAIFSGSTCDDTASDTDSESDSTLSAIIGGVLLVAILIAGAILDAAIRHRFLRKADEEAQREQGRELAARAKQKEEEESEQLTSSFFAL